MEVVRHDANDDTALDLACIRGFDHHCAETYLDENYFPNKPEGEKAFNTTKRFQIVKRLLEYTDHEGRRPFLITNSSIKSGFNTPLHWAFYWADIDLVEILYKCNPALIFKINRNKQIPFDIALQARDKFTSQKSLFIIYYILGEIYIWLTKCGYNDQVNDIEFSSDSVDVNHREEIKKFYFKLKTVEDCKKKMDYILYNESAEEWEEDKALYKKATLTIRHPVHGLKDLEKNNISGFVQRIFLWFAFFKSETKFLKLMELFNCSPFDISSQGRAPIHMVCQQGQHDFLALILIPTYKYEDSVEEKFNLKTAANCVTDFNQNTALHTAAQSNKWKCYKKLKEIVYGIDLQVDNFRGYNSVELSNPKLPYFKTMRKELKMEKLDEMLRADPFQDLLCSEKKIKLFNTNFYFCVISAADSPDPYNTTVYSQLMNIQKDWAPKGEFKVEVSLGFTNSDLINKLNLGVKSDANKNKETASIANQLLKNMPNMENSDSDLVKKQIDEMTPEEIESILKGNYFIYKIDLDKKLIQAIAEQLKLRVFNAKGKFHTKFKMSDSNDYEPIRDIQVHPMIVNIMMREFNIVKYKESGQVIDYFPLDDSKQRMEIDVLYKKHFWQMIFGSVFHRKGVNGSLRPITAVAFYFGVQHGFYFGFLL
jgi:ankyrin repeat protein